MWRVDAWSSHAKTVAKTVLTRRVGILAYHRVTSLDCDPQLLSCSPENFSRHLDILRQFFDVIPLSRVAAWLAQSRIPRKAIVVTFDDGYADNYTEALPLLEQYSIPATVFVTSGHVGQNTEFWWDELERLILRASTLPETLDITIDGVDFHHAMKNNPTNPTISWNVTQQPQTSQHNWYLILHRLLRSMTHTEQQTVLTELKNWAHTSTPPRRSHRSLTRHELRNLAAHNLIEIGSHTQTHPVLSERTCAQLKREIAQSKEDLQYLSGKPVTSFCYPFGSQKDIGQISPQIVRDSAYETAVGTFGQLVTKRTSPFLYPRLLVRNWNAAHFHRTLNSFLHGI